MADHEFKLPKEAAEYLRIDRSTLWRYRERGLITYVRIGDTVRYRKRDLDAFIDAGERKAKAASK